MGNLGSASGEYREVMRYEFAPAGMTPTATNEFYVYVSHYKASTGATNEYRRNGEAKIIRNDEANNLPANARVLYVGDYNPDNNSGEPAYQTICSNSAPNWISPQVPRVLTLVRTFFKSPTPVASVCISPSMFNLSLLAMLSKLSAVALDGRWQGTR